MLRSSGKNIAEKVLSIVCHIVKGEATIREKLEKQGEKKQGPDTEKSSTPTSSVAAMMAAVTPPQRSIPISPAYVQQVCSRRIRPSNRI